MSLWDDRILEYIREEGSGAPTEIAERKEFRVSRQHVSRRLSKLAENDLLRALGNGVYVITERGEAYLDGRFDVENEVYLDKEGRAVGTTPPEDWSPEDAGSATGS